MASSVPPKRATAYTTYVALTSQADPNIFKTSPTLAAGDVKVSKDGGSYSNIGSLPSQIGTTGVLAVALTSSEMTADTVTVLFHDASGAEWQDLLLVIHTAARLVDDLAFPTTSGRSIDVDADGGVEVDSLQDGAITANAIASGAITDAKLADGAIAAAKIASGAANKIADHVLRRSWASAAVARTATPRRFGPCWGRSPSWSTNWLEQRHADHLRGRRQHGAGDADSDLERGCGGHYRVGYRLGPGARTWPSTPGRARM
jgi:hypothetical protein